jgi:hypothetical protein
MIRVAMLVAISSLSFLSCNPRTQFIGKWTRNYAEKDAKLGDLQYEFVLNIGKNNMYSMITRIYVTKMDMSKVASQESGVWQIKSGALTFMPRVCMEKNRVFELEEMECGPPREQTVEIKGDKWQFVSNKGNTVELTREPE